MVIKIDTDGIVSTVAGTGVRGFSGDGGPATEAQLAGPAGVAVDSDGNLYVADQGNDRIRKVDRDGIITTVAGTGTSGYSGDGGPATEAQLAGAAFLAIDRSGDVYLSSANNHVIRKIDQEGIITTVVGTGEPGFSGDGGPAIEAALNRPNKLAFGAEGNLYVADLLNYRVRKVTFEQEGSP